LKQATENIEAKMNGAVMKKVEHHVVQFKDVIKQQLEEEMQQCDSR